MNNRSREKGITIYLSIIVLSILLSIVLGLSIFLIDQIRMVKDMENSISAFYAAVFYNGRCSRYKILPS